MTDAHGAGVAREPLERKEAAEYNKQAHNKQAHDKQAQQRAATDNKQAKEVDNKAQGNRKKQASKPWQS